LPKCRKQLFLHFFWPFLSLFFSCFIVVAACPSFTSRTF
jgi:hypothetical protein